MHLVCSRVLILCRLVQNWQKQKRVRLVLFVSHIIRGHAVRTLSAGL